MTCNELQELRFRGDRLKALTLIQSRSDVASALIAVRIELSSGWIKQARHWLKIASERCSTPDERAEIALHRALLAATTELDVVGGLRSAAEPLPPGSLPRLWQAKLRLTAAIYRELPVEELQTTRRGLRQIGRDLSDDGELYEAHGVAMDRADRLPPRLRLCAWRAVARMGERDGKSGTSASAYLRLADLATDAGEDPYDLLEAATECYTEINHQDGLQRVQASRERHRVEVLGAPLDQLRSLADVQWQSGFRKSAINTLMEAGRIALKRGERQASVEIDETLRDKAEEAGYLALVTDSLLRQADRAMRDGLHARARDLCNAALAKPMPRMLQAMVTALRASSWSFVDARANAIRDHRQAVRVFRELGADDSASDIVCALAGAIAASRQPDAVAEADALLLEWARSDDSRGATFEAYQKRLQRAQGPILLYLAAERKAQHVGLLSQAEALVAEAEASLGPNPNVHADRGRMIALRTQTEAQIATARDRHDLGLAAQEVALAAYEAQGLGFEAANCRYLLGCYWLNRANEQRGTSTLDAVKAAWSYFQAALDFYDARAGMRQQAAQTRYMMAKLSLNSLPLFDEQSCVAIAQEAAELLSQAGTEIDDLRRAYSAPGHAENYAAKSTFSAIAHDIATDALRLHLALDPDPVAAWLWTVRSKAQAYADMLGLLAVVPAQAREAAEHDSALRRLIEAEASASRSVAASAPAERGQAVAALDAALNNMRAEPRLADYARRRGGETVGSEDLSRVAAATERPFALVDWVQVGDALFVIVARAGEAPTFERLPVSAHAIDAQIGVLFAKNRIRMTLKGGPDRLSAFAALVEPLERLARDGETLLLCPTGILSSLPLHALPVGSGTLWHRHPIAYTLGLGVLRHTCDPPSMAGAGVAVFGDPTLDRDRARQTAQQIARSIGKKATLGSEATRHALVAALRSARVVHYQGHADFDGEEPMDAHLLLAGDEKLDARRIFDLPGVTAATVTLGACKGAALGTRAGDEPLGLIAALLMAGVKSVTAAAWSVSEQSAGTFMERYYADLLEGAAPVDALRDAGLTLASASETRNLYHWAPFRLYGNPWHPPFAKGAADEQ